MNIYNYTSLIPLLPFAGFLLLGLFGKKLPEKISGFLGVLFIGVAAILSLATAYQYFIVDGAINGAYPTLEPIKITWLQFTSTLSIFPFGEC